MKIRTQLIFTLSFFGLILIGMAASLLLTNRQVGVLRQQEEIAGQIEQRANELNYLAGDYLMYGESQQRTRWESSFTSFSRDLAQLTPLNLEQQTIISHITADQKRLQAIFKDVASTLEASAQTSGGTPDSAFNQVSWSRMEVQNQSIAFEAALLSRQLRDRADRLIQINFLLIYMLIGIFGVYLLINYYLIDRRTLRSIAELQAGTEIVGSGHLGFTIAVKRADEIGELSHAFNQMTANLKEVTASKADLEREVTERKRAEVALRRNEALLLETGKMAKIGGWELDLRTRQPEWTLETYRIHEVDPSFQPKLESAIEFYALEARPKITEAVRRAIEEGQSYDLELPLITAKGRNIWIRTIGQPEFRDGRCVRLFGTFQDITERKQAEAALLEAALQKQTFQYTRTLIEVSLDPLVTISPEGKITDVNEATVRATGVPRTELVGTDFSMFFTEPEVAERGYRQVFAQGFVTDYPLTVRHRDGHLMDVLYNASLYKDANGNVLGVFAAARDVTVQKRAEAELRHHKENLELLVKERTADLEESNRELARSNENLEQFAYVASHDLQEPLRIMSSYSQLLERRYKDKLDQDANDFIEFIVDAAARMQKLITDLLAYSRAGRQTSDTFEVDCNEVLRKLVTGMARTIEEANGQVIFEKLPTITVHESNLIQLFQNLIGNALKFHGEQPPCIHVSARCVEAEWIFSVRDNGIGIEPQYSQRIFMIFQRLHPRDKYPGTGIGLSICKKIVENLGGRIWVESEPGQGSTFYFTVPSEKSSR
ncbi:MAG TPA: ATP-binding protein [Anaerolineales bacterium]|nr:ATP-binding protein [Anaerolineales bacterium]